MWQCRLLLLLAIAAGLVSCESESEANRNRFDNAARVSDAATAGGTGSSSTSTAEAVELLAARSAGYLDYGWAGMDTSTTMLVRVINRTEREWLVEIESGTKLEPSSANVQSMVVTEEVEVHMHPHESHDFEVQVACLDISKPPPAGNDFGWTAEVSPRLNQFIACVKQILEQIAGTMDADTAARVRRSLPNFLQIALWQARGATEDQWVEFFIHYQKMDPVAARQAAATFEQIGRYVVQECPSI